MDQIIAFNLLDTNFQFNWVITLGVIGGIFLLVIIKKIITRYGEAHNHEPHTIYKVKVPKEKPKEEKGMGGALQLMREEIARGETMFASIGGLHAEKTLKSWLWGRSDHFAFEIVAHNGKISFYVAAPKIYSQFLEKQILAHFPEAELEEVADYNSFNKQSVIRAGILKAKRHYIFPFRDYTEMEVDPLSGIINSLSKLNQDESISIQYIVRSAPKNWHRKIKRLVNRAYQTQSFKNITKFHSSGFKQVIDQVISTPTPDKAGGRAKELTEKEKETLKKMENKSSKAGLDVNIRVVVSANNQSAADAHLDNIKNVFSEFNYYYYGNSFKHMNKKHQSANIDNFIYRRFIRRQGFILNTQEIDSMYHFPLAATETPNIEWLSAKTGAAPSNVPTEGILLGYNTFRGIKKEIHIKKDDRRRHTYVVGKSGTGKSVLLLDMAIQDIENGEGVCVIDPNGDLIEDIMNRIPPERAEDVIVFSPADIERPLGLNLLEYDGRYPEQKSFVINEMINIFDKLYDLKATGGPMFEQYIRNAMLLVMDDPDSGATLMEIPKVLSDENFRRSRLEKCKNITVVDFWRKEAEKAGGEAALANIVPYITSKLTQFISNDMMRPIIGQQKSAFNFRDVMDSKKILLIDLPKGAIGETNAYLLGMIVVGKILMAALSRTDIAAASRQDFYLYIDEFQNFTTNSICQILSEARKYALALTVAHQYIGQLSKGQDTAIKDAIFGNVGTMVAFRVGAEDAEFLIKSFGPVFNQYDMVNVGRSAFIKLLVDGQTLRPFSLNTIWPLLGTARPDFSKKIRSLSRFKYGQDKRLVEYEIAKRTGMIKT